ncbi:glycine-rich cell wall structural protein 1.8 isoform X3 [Alosa sapidissima]|uniref:glycine-rich cell wall structural protein 1.8 isoform X3 n=1 Tax=Alosa sapidissima TaxID=34773 RepID=UPI001C090B76|nr:glycine-rich cell wall structural protein 1.8 isoform X3 [Alosa sapidissima]
MHSSKSYNFAASSAKSASSVSSYSVKQGSKSPVAAPVQEGSLISSVTPDDTGPYYDDMTHALDGTRLGQGMLQAQDRKSLATAAVTPVETGKTATSFNPPLDAAPMVPEVASKSIWSAATPAQAGKSLGSQPLEGKSVGPQVPGQQEGKSQQAAAPNLGGFLPTDQGNGGGGALPFGQGQKGNGYGPAPAISNGNGAKGNGYGPAPAVSNGQAPISNGYGPGPAVSNGQGGKPYGAGGPGGQGGKPSKTGYGPAPAFSNGQAPISNGYGPGPAVSNGQGGKPYGAGGPGGQGGKPSKTGYGPGAAYPGAVGNGYGGLGQGGYPMGGRGGKQVGYTDGMGGYPGAGLGDGMGLGLGGPGAGAKPLTSGYANGYTNGNGYMNGAGGYPVLADGAGMGSKAGKGPGGASMGPAGSLPYGGQPVVAAGLGVDGKSGGYGAGPVPLGLSPDASLGAGLEPVNGKFGGMGQLPYNGAPVIPAGLEGDGGYPYGAAQQLGLGADAGKSASKYGDAGAALGAQPSQPGPQTGGKPKCKNGNGRGYGGPQPAAYAGPLAASQGGYGGKDGNKYGMNGYYGNGYKG